MESQKANNPAVLWEGETQTGEPKLTLKVEEALSPGYYTVLKNRYKQPGEKSPDWKVMAQQDGQERRAYKAAPPPAGAGGSDSDVPF